MLQPSCQAEGFMMFLELASMTHLLFVEVLHAAILPLSGLCFYCFSGARARPWVHSGSRRELSA